MTEKTIQSQLQAACETVRAQTAIIPQVAFVLGSGLGGLADWVEHAQAIPYLNLEGFPTTSAQGHQGELVLGYLAGVPVVMMRGRAHLYEGHSVAKATFPIRLMRQLGAETLIVSNASGGINPRFESGQVVLMDSHIDLLFRPQGPKITTNGAATLPYGQVGRRGDVYDESLRRLAVRVASKLGYPLAQGTYLATLGPNYETRAEYRFFRMIGADMVGMSTVPEVLVAVEEGLRVLGFSVVTNVAKPDSTPNAVSKTDHAEVLDWANVAQQRLLPLVRQILSAISGHPD